MSSKSFKELSTTKELKDYLNNAFHYTRDFAYHYTSLKTVLSIFDSKQLWFSSFDKTNDAIERDFVTKQTKEKYFFSFMRTKIENFGMWAMYGGLTKKPKANLNSIYVKIRFPVSLLKDFIKQQKLSASVVAYTWLNNNKNDEKHIIYCGSQTNDKYIKIDKTILSGYIKDTAWKYEQELRIWSDKPKVEFDDSFLKGINIIPSPLYSVEDCKKALSNNPKYKNVEKLLSKSFIKNDYESTYLPK